MPYEFDIDIEVNIQGECYDKLKIAKLKSDINKLIKDSLESNDNVCEYEIGIDVQKNFDKIEE